MTALWYLGLLTLIILVLLIVAVSVYQERREDRAFDKHIKAWPYRGDPR